MPAVTLCVICEKPLDDDRRRRADAVTCSKRCRTALWRARRKARRNGGVPPAGVTRDGYGSALDDDRAIERFYRQLEQHREASQPLSQEELAALDHMRRNPGVLHPLLAARLVEAETERRQRELAESASHEPPIKVEDPFDPTSQGSLARRAIESRNANRRYAADPNMYALRPGLSGLPSGPSRYPGDLEAEMTDAPWGRSTPRSSIGW
jgi:predicted nucleic acid-binding Zn ribbon protein